MEERVIEDYLKVIFNAGEWSSKPATTGAIASRLGLSPSTVSEGVKKLADRGLVVHERYGAITLTSTGEERALLVVRKHRLIESFLVDYLGYAWDEIHDEAEVLEHAVSDTFIDRLAERLGNPTLDPHGDPIPDAGGLPSSAEHLLIRDCDEGARVRVERVNDEPEILRGLDGAGITIGSRLVVTDQSETGTTVRHGSLEHRLPAAVAAGVRVSPLD